MVAWLAADPNKPTMPTCCAPQVQGELATVERTNMDTTSFARVGFNADCESAINEQIKWVQQQLAAAAEADSRQHEGAAAAAASFPGISTCCSSRLFPAAPVPLHHSSVPPS
jgi:hypothetical protein